MCGSVFHYGLELYWGLFPKSALSPLAMVLRFDPMHDCQAELQSGAPGLPVEHVLLQQTEERFHCCVISAGPNSPSRASQLVSLQSLLKLPRPELGEFNRSEEASCVRWRTDEVSTEGTTVVPSECGRNGPSSEFCQVEGATQSRLDGPMSGQSRDFEPSPSQRQELRGTGDNVTTVAV